MLDNNVYYSCEFSHSNVSSDVNIKPFSLIQYVYTLFLMQFLMNVKYLHFRNPVIFGTFYHCANVIIVYFLKDYCNILLFRVELIVAHFAQGP